MTLGNIEPWNDVRIMADGLESVGVGWGLVGSFGTVGVAVTCVHTRWLPGPLADGVAGLFVHIWVAGLLSDLLRRNLSLLV